MNNVTPIVLRTAGVCLRSSPWPKPVTLLRGFHVASRPLSIAKQTNPRLQIQCSARAAFRSSFSSASRNSFRTSPASWKLSAYHKTREQGLAFQDGDLSPDELKDVYGAVVPPSHFSNRLLRVLHGRRVDGTLDIDLPADMQPILQKYPYAVDSALYWLRKGYPVDEDAAIIGRIEREEASGEYENPSELAQRGQDIGLYGPQSDGSTTPERSTTDETSYAPQSGNYQARLSDTEGDVFGRSELDKIRAKNEAEAKEEEERLQAQIDRITEEATAKAKEKSEALAVRPEQGVEVSSDEVRPPNEFEKWVLRARNRAQSNLTLESPEIQNLTTAQRLVPSFVFIALCCLGCYLFSQYWIPPRRSERLLPSVSLSFATIGGIMAINTVIFCAWRFPPALRILNTFCCVAPAYPRAASMLGNLFSHHTTRHFLTNMVALLIFGPSLHEEIGRGTFIAIYLASGMVGSFASLAYYVSRGIMTTTSMGASGCIWGVTAAYLGIHSDHTFSLFFIDEAWKDTFQMKGWVFLLVLLAADVFGARTAKNIDTMAHWGGVTTGLVAAAFWKYNLLSSSPSRQRETAPAKNLMLFREEKPMPKRS